MAVSLGVFGQSEGPKIVVNLDGFHYPVIARQARIQGDVLFELSADGRRLVSGGPLLATAAEANLETWTLEPLAAGRYRVWYHFVLSNPLKTEVAPLGNKFDRFLLRLFHAPTTTIVYHCDADPSKQVESRRYATSREGDDYVVDVFVTGWSPCLNTESSELALSSRL